MNFGQGAADSRALDSSVDPEQSLADIVMVLCVMALNSVGSAQGKHILGKAVAHCFG